jgi:endonuclease/exonuclease/phosphatase family metal-dependent hydrolase
MKSKYLRINKLRWFDKIVVAMHLMLALALFLSYLSPYVNPADFWIFGFLGLGYPFMMFANWLFAVYHGIRKQWILLVATIFLFLLGIKQFNAYYVLFSFNGKIENPRAEFKIMSYNVRLFDLYNWTKNTETKNLIFRLLHREVPDIICFQEFYMRTDAWFPTKDSLMDLLKLPYIQEGYTHEIHGEQFFGLATMSRYPIVNQGIIEFDNDANNLVIYCDVVLPSSDTIRVFNTHLQSIRFKKEDYSALGQSEGGEFVNTDEEKEQKIFSRLKNAFQNRGEQVLVLRDAIEASPYPTLLCGDFNDSPNSYVYHRLNSILRDAHKESGQGFGHTFVGITPPFRIDFIFHSSTLHSYDFMVHPEVYSDHKAISATVQLGN